MHVTCVTLNKMADGREDERATFQFIEEIQNCRPFNSKFKIVRHVANLPCVMVWREFDVWTPEFADFFKFANTSLQT